MTHPTGTGTTTRTNAAAVDATTGFATTWAPNPDGEVSAIAVSGGGTKVWLGGTFLNAGGTIRPSLAAIDSGTALATTPLVTPGGPVKSLAISGVNLYIGGDFTSVESPGPVVTDSRHLAAVSVNNGAPTGFAPDPNATVNAIAATPDVVAVGGVFGGIGGERRANAAAIESDGSLSTWRPDPNAPVEAVTLAGSSVYLGGFFNAVNKPGGGTVTRSRVAAVDTASGFATAWNPSVTGSAIYDIAVAGSTAYLGGIFTKIGVTNRNNAGAVGVINGLDAGWKPNPDGFVYDIEPAGDSVFVGGQFLSVTDAAGTGTTGRVGLARVDAVAGFDTGWNPMINGTILAIAVSGSNVYVGGSITQARGPSGAISRRGTVQIDTTTGIASAWEPIQSANTVSAIALSGSTCSSAAPSGRSGAAPGTSRGLAVRPSTRPPASTSTGIRGSGARSTRWSRGRRAESLQEGPSSS